MQPTADWMGVQKIKWASQRHFGSFLYYITVFSGEKYYWRSFWYFRCFFLFGKNTGAYVTIYIEDLEVYSKNLGENTRRSTAS